MLDSETKCRIDACRDILVGKVPNPQSQVEQITIASIYKFMDNMDAEAEQALINANPEMIRRFEAKIKTNIDRVWSAA